MSSHEQSGNNTYEDHCNGNCANMTPADLQYLLKQIFHIRNCSIMEYYYLLIFLLFDFAVRWGESITFASVVYFAIAPKLHCSSTPPRLPFSNYAFAP